MSIQLFSFHFIWIHPGLIFNVWTFRTFWPIYYFIPFISPHLYASIVCHLALAQVERLFVPFVRPLSHCLCNPFVVSEIWQTFRTPPIPRIRQHPRLSAPPLGILSVAFLIKVPQTRTRITRIFYKRLPFDFILYVSGAESHAANLNLSHATRLSQVGAPPASSHQ